MLAATLGQRDEAARNDVVEPDGVADVPGIDAVAREDLDGFGEVGTAIDDRAEDLLLHSIWIRPPGCVFS